MELRRHASPNELLLKMSLNSFSSLISNLRQKVLPNVAGWTSSDCRLRMCEVTVSNKHLSLRTLFTVTTDSILNSTFRCLSIICCFPPNLFFSVELASWWLAVFNANPETASLAKHFRRNSNNWTSQSQIVAHYYWLQTENNPRSLSIRWGHLKIECNWSCVSFTHGCLWEMCSLH